MPDQRVGILYTDVEARLTKLDGQLRQGEQKVKAAAQRMEKESRFNFGGDKLIGGTLLGVGVFQAADAGIKALTAGMALFRGEVDAARDAIFQLPLGIGQVARAVDALADLLDGPLEEVMPNSDGKNKDAIRERGIDRRRALNAEAGLAGLEGLDLQLGQIEAERKKRLGALVKDQREAFKAGIDLRKDFQAEADAINRIAEDKAAAARRKDAEQRTEKEEREKEAAMRARDQALKLEREKAEAVFDLRDKNDVMDLKRRDEVAANRLEIERDTDKQIRDAKASGNFALIPEIEREKRLRLDGGPRRAEQIDITRMAFGQGDGLRAAAEKELPKIAKSNEEQTGVLRSLLNAVTRLQFSATTSN